MGSRYEVEVTVCSARELKNVNWRNGDLKPYAVLWIDDGAKCSTRVDLDTTTSADSSNPTWTWDEKVLVPFPPTSRSLNDAVLYIDVVHANANAGVKPLVGSATVQLRDLDVGASRVDRNLRLKRPSGRPQGRLDVRLAVREPARYYDQYPAPAHAAAGYGNTRDPYNSAVAYGAPAPAVGYAAGYGTAQPAPYAAAPPAGYPSTYGAAAPPQVAYSAAPVVVASAPEKKGNKMGAGTGVAVGAAAGLLGGLALAGGVSMLGGHDHSHGGGGYGYDYDDDDDDDGDY